jgi:hypothetical protein
MSTDPISRAIQYDNDARTLAMWLGEYGRRHEEFIERFGVAGSADEVWSGEPDGDPRVAYENRHAFLAELGVNSLPAEVCARRCFLPLGPWLQSVVVEARPQVATLVSQELLGLTAEPVPPVERAWARFHTSPLSGRLAENFDMSEVCRLIVSTQVVDLFIGLGIWHVWESWNGTAGRTDTNVDDPGPTLVFLARAVNLVADLVDKDGYSEDDFAMAMAESATLLGVEDEVSALLDALLGDGDDIEIDTFHEVVAAWLFLRTAANVPHLADDAFVALLTAATYTMDFHDAFERAQASYESDGPPAVSDDMVGAITDNSNAAIIAWFDEHLAPSMGIAAPDDVRLVLPLMAAHQGVSDEDGVAAIAAALDICGCEHVTQSLIEVITRAFVVAYDLPLEKGQILDMMEPARPMVEWLEQDGDLERIAEFVDTHRMPQRVADALTEWIASSHPVTLASVWAALRVELSKPEVAERTFPTLAHLLRRHLGQHTRMDR